MSEQTDNRQLGAIALIGLGIFFLANQVFNFNIFGLLWPFFVILPGVPFLYYALNGGKEHSGLIFPGLIISGTGVILLLQAITGHWESWAYIWTLYPAMVGYGLQFHGEREGDHVEVRTGKEMMRWSLVALAGFAFFFEFLIFGGLSGILLPLVLLAAGLYLLKNQITFTSHRRDDAPVKVKNDLTADMPKPKNRYEPSAEINPELRRKIEEALAEADDSAVRSNGAE
ncbi:MAG: hypothetical protein OHK0046_15050 [Anaerolineae bacterium]